MDILFIGKKNDSNAECAAHYLLHLFPQSTIVFGHRGETFPEIAKQWHGDYIFSYLSPWIIKEELLKKATKAAINWHPGPPEYPGIGCTNFAIYNQEKEFGITCHYMNPKVDTGKIIEVKKFKISETDSVYSITQKCYTLILSSFFQIVDKLTHNIPLPITSEQWKRQPYTRKELDALCEINTEMTAEEIDRRIKATTYDRPWAYTIIKGKKFYWVDRNC